MLSHYLGKVLFGKEELLAFACCVVIATVFYCVENFGHNFWDGVRRLKDREDLRFILLNTAFTERLIISLFWIVGFACFAFEIDRRAYSVSGPVWVTFLAVIVLMDFVYYWIHRLLHTKVFWPFHAAHHQPENVDLLATYRLHPIQYLMISMRFFVGFAFHLTAASWLGIQLLTFAYGIFIHINKPWSLGVLHYLLVSPVSHRWHHERRSGSKAVNYGNMFMIWDLMFGTAHIEPGRLPAALGIDGMKEESFSGQVWVPFKESWKAIGWSSKKI